MTTPDLPPLPKPPFVVNGAGFKDKPMWWHEDQMRAYGDARAAAAVLAEREKSEAMRAALVELVALQKETKDGVSWGTDPAAEKGLRIRWSAAWAAARAAIRAEPNDHGLNSGDLMAAMMRDGAGA